MASTVDGDGEVVGDLVGGVAGRDIDAVGAEGDVDEAAGGRLGGEVEGEAGAVGFGLAGGVVVDLEDEVGGAVEEGGDAVGHAEGEGAGGPAAESAGGEEAGGSEAGIAGAGIALAGGAGGVLEDDDVVDDFGVAGADIDGADPVIFGGGGGDDEALVEVGAVGGDGEGGGHGGFEIGRAERPAVGDFGRRRRLARIAFGRAGGGPTGEEGDLGGGESHLMLEVRFGGQPGGHVALGGDGGDEFGAFGGSGVGDEGEGSDSAVAMAGDAARIEDGRDVVREGGRGGGGEEEGQESRDAHLLIVAHEGVGNEMGGIPSRRRLPAHMASCHGSSNSRRWPIFSRLVRR